MLVLPFLSLLISFAASFNKLGYDASAAQRWVPWIRASRLLIEHPWFGVGFNAIKQAQESHGWRALGGADVSLDGGLLFVAAMTGVVGLGLYVRMLVRVARGARSVWRDGALHPTDRAHATATFAATAAVVVHSFFVNSLLLPFVMQILWVMWARLTHVRAARRARIGLAVLLPVVALASCDPCAGVSCSTTPHVTLTGTIVNHTTGAGVSGVKIDLRATDAGGHTAGDVDNDRWSRSVAGDGGLQTSGNAISAVTVSAPNASRLYGDASDADLLEARGRDRGRTVDRGPVHSGASVGVGLVATTRWRIGALRAHVGTCGARRASRRGDEQFRSLRAAVRGTGSRNVGRRAHDCPPVTSKSDRPA